MTYAALTPCRKPWSLQSAAFSSLRVLRDGGRVKVLQGRAGEERPKGGICPVCQVCVRTGERPSGVTRAVPG